MFFTSPSDSKTAKLKRVIRLPKSQLTIATATQGKMKFPGGFEGIKTVWGYMKVPFGFAAIDVSVKSGGQACCQNADDAQRFWDWRQVSIAGPRVARMVLG